MKSHPSRRTFLKIAGTSTLSSLLLPLMPKVSFSAQPEPRFFILIVANGGMDCSYTFDARPLELTQKGVIQNYFKSPVEPTLLTGSNQTSSLRTSLTDEFTKKYFSDFAVLNGVHMAVGFDGHSENTNYLLSGNVFGAEGFIPHLNMAFGPDATALDAIQQGMLTSKSTNTSHMIPLSVAGATQMIELLKTSKQPAGQSNLSGQAMDFMASRFDVAARLGKGSFSHASFGFLESLGASKELTARLLRAPIPTPDPNAPPIGDDPLYPQLITGFFQSQVSRSAVWSIDGAPLMFDAHSESTARQQPKLIGESFEKIVKLLDHLKTTAFNDHQSFLDVTTVMITGEFGRTLRQNGNSVEHTGTDHNPLANTVLLGGAGIKGGQVIGRSDVQTADEIIFGGHRSLEPTGVPLKTMGYAFNFEQMKPAAIQPSTYVPTDYLNFASVINTLYSSFGVSPERYRSVLRNGKPAPLLKGLLS